MLPTWWHVWAKPKEFVKSLMERCLALTTTPPNYHVSYQTNWMIHVLPCSQAEPPFWTKGIITNATSSSIKHKFRRCSSKLLWSLRRIGEMMGTCCFFKIPSSLSPIKNGVAARCSCCWRIIPWKHVIWVNPRHQPPITLSVLLLILLINPLKLQCQLSILVHNSKTCKIQLIMQSYQ